MTWMFENRLYIVVAVAMWCFCWFSHRWPSEWDKFTQAGYWMLHIAKWCEQFETNECMELVATLFCF